MIHPQTVIDPDAELGVNVSVGPFSVVGAGVQVGDGTEIGAHVVIKGPTTIGRENRIFQFASVGDEPQDKKYAGEDTRLEIGDRNTIREYCTLNRGTLRGGGVTRIGNDNWIMAYVHIAHDCVVGSHTIFANGASLAGHVVVDDHAILGGFTLVHQFCRIGADTFCSMGSVVRNDVPPYVTVSGDPAVPFGVNAEGLRRRTFTQEQIQAIRRGYRVIYRSGLRTGEAVEKLREQEREFCEFGELADFLVTSQRGIVR